jgi:hypothetical protein
MKHERKSANVSIISAGVAAGLSTLRSLCALKITVPGSSRP